MKLQSQQDNRQESLHEEQFLASKEYFQNLVSLCPDAIVGIARDGTIILFNEAAERLSGFSAREVINRVNIGNLFYKSMDDARELKRKIYSDDYGGPGCLDELEIEIRHRSGHRVPIRLSATLLFENGKEVGSVGFFHDLSLRKQMERELRQLSITCSLTSLYNRRHFYCVVSDEIRRSERYGRPLSLVYFDLDHFKPFNDTLGHQEGDNVLRLVATCASQSFRSHDHLFRMGGDEFVVLMVETAIARAVKAAERFRLNFNRQWAKVMPAHKSNNVKPVTISLGVAQLVEGERHDGLLKRADLAMYEAKRAGGDRLVRAASSIGHHEP